MLPLLNRNFKLPEDNWYHVVPLGEYPHPSGVMQVIDKPAVEAMQNRFNQDAKAENFPGLLVDFDHFSDDLDKPSEAAGWVEELQNRENGLWGQIRWTDSGESAVKGGRYRLVSPVWLPSETEPIANSTKKRLRPLRLAKLALTNEPNLKGMVPLSNRSGTSVTPAGAEEPITQMKKVTDALGLPAEATEDQIAASVSAIQNRVSALEATNKSLLEAQVESDLAKYANRIKPEAKDRLKTQLLSNRAAAIEILELMPEIDQKETKPPMHNRNQTQTPTGTANNNKYAEQNRLVQEIKLKNRCTHQQAWDAAKQQKPELFQDE